MLTVVCSNFAWTYRILKGSLKVVMRKRGEVGDPLEGSFAALFFISVAESDTVLPSPPPAFQKFDQQHFQKEIE